MRLEILILFYICDGFQVILNSTGEIIQEFCVNHQQKYDLAIYVDSDQVYEFQWDLIFIYTDEAMSLNGCLTQQYQKRAYLDWAMRLGNQIVNASRQEFNFTLFESNQFYNLINIPNVENNIIILSQTGKQFIINSTDLKNNSDYYIRLTAKSIFGQQEKLMQIRVMVQKSDLFARNSVLLKKVVNPDESYIQLLTQNRYDWKIFIKDPTRFGFIQTSISVQDTQIVNISLTPTWTDKLYIITMILVDTYGKQLYQTDWFHQIGYQWINQESNNCSYAYLMDITKSNWTQRLSCLEWGSMEIPVLLPQYDFINLQQNIECSQNGRLQSSNQPKPFCICKDNFTGVQCELFVDEALYNLTQQYYAILIQDFLQQNLDNSSFLRSHYLIVKQTQGKDQQLFDLINNKNFNFGQQLLLTFDTFILKSILNEQINLINSTFKAISNLKSLFETIGILQFTNFLFYISTINQLVINYNNSNNSAYVMEYQYNPDSEYLSRCTYLSQNFIFAQMVLYSIELTNKIKNELYSQYMNCQAFTLNGNLILNINTNMTILTNFQISDITRPTQLRCVSNSSNNTCKIHKLYDYFAEVSFDTNYGPYTIERSPIIKSVDYQTLIDSIKNPSAQTRLFIFIFLYYFCI